MDGRTCTVGGQTFMGSTAFSGTAVAADASGGVTFTFSAGTYAYAEMSFW
jgi:hypothetical protein